MTEPTYLNYDTDDGEVDSQVEVTDSLERRVGWVVRRTDDPKPFFCFDIEWEHPARYYYRRMLVPRTWTSYAALVQKVEEIWQSWNADGAPREPME